MRTRTAASVRSVVLACVDKLGPSGMLRVAWREFWPMMRMVSAESSAGNLGIREAASDAPAQVLRRRCLVCDADAAI